MVVPVALGYEEHARTALDTGALEGRRVLVVDDSDFSRRILLSLLTRWGMRPRATASPREALQWVERGDPFDLAILDRLMPEMDGLVLARRIRKQRGDAFPMLLVSSLSKRDAAEGADDSAVNAQLTEPLKPSGLHDALVEMIAPESVRGAAQATAPTKRSGAALTNGTRRRGHCAFFSRRTTRSTRSSRYGCWSASASAQMS